MATCHRNKKRKRRSKQNLRHRRQEENAEAINITEERVLKEIKCENYHASLNRFELHFVCLICLILKHFLLKIWTKHFIVSPCIKQEVEF